MAATGPLQEHKRSASKYDFVKVRVWLDKPGGPMGGVRTVARSGDAVDIGGTDGGGDGDGGDAVSVSASSASEPPPPLLLQPMTTTAAATAAHEGTHHYILSRYLLCRSLECIQIPTAVARTMSLQLKKTLVDLGLLDIPQSLLETYLHKIMAMFGYRERHVARYHMVIGFQSRRIPLVVLLSGTAWIGKSTMANKLADRLNLPNVLQTGTVFELMSTLIATEVSPGDGAEEHSGESSYATAAPCWEREWHGDDSALLAAYKCECMLVREGVESDIEKVVRDGKALIVVGTHLDPAMYRHRLAEAGIVLRIVLTLGEEDHRHFIRCTSSHHPQRRNLPCWLHNVRVIQRHLVQRCCVATGGGIDGRGLGSRHGGCCIQALGAEEHPVVEMKMNVHSFTETIDALHTAILERISTADR